MSRRHPYYPIYLDLDGRLAVIVGAGEVSVRKAGSLLRCGARVTIIGPDVHEAIDTLAAEGSVRLLRKRYDPEDLEGAAIAIAATSNPEVNQQVASDCNARGILVNVIDDTPACDFIVPAVVESGSIQIAISTGGQSPALARRLRHDLERIVGPEYGEVNDLFGELRGAAKESLTADDDRKRFFDRLLQTGVLELLRDGRRQDAWDEVERTCAESGVPLPASLRARFD
ncbi:MAG TPA: bifunctional precorrin-2 dehydrogenase/sirohydrochlorin ferrochelatase [Thermoanaerobaculia bacterium]